MSLLVDPFSIKNKAICGFLLIMWSYWYSDLNLTNFLNTFMSLILKVLVLSNIFAYLFHIYICLKLDYQCYY